MLPSQRADGLRAGKTKRSPSPSPPPGSRSSENSPSHKTEQAEKGDNESPFISHGPVLPDENRAAASSEPQNTVSGGTRAPETIPSTTVTCGPRPQLQPIGTQAWTWIQTSHQPAGDNDAYPDSTIPAYYRAPHRGPRRIRSGQSSRPGVDFIVRREPLDPVSSTVGPSNGR
ncbi:hypothetical protein HO173_008120 [Letharia columbiana]|uniref:Uncharacterized protein n=1 Tax=Letharia columbiana TaxID=112416 RepID=A0A8H6FRW1_9LECA|nr:uncharacterized protein HO173_008120 [Letharia columbiana]KAF6233563.1 hypothetical protein HO173_008120 [Letharia columbiana]